MAQVDIFEQIAESVEVDRLQAEVEHRQQELQNQSNQIIVDLGMAAVKNNLINRDNVRQITWDTVARHRVLMRSIGYVPIVRPEMPKSPSEAVMKISSRRVRITPDISVALRQWTTNRRDGAEFRESLESSTLEGSIDRFVCPRSTKIAIFDRDTVAAVNVHTLSPDSSNMPDKDFYDEWIGHFSPFNGDEYAAPCKRRSGVVKPIFLDDKQLIVAAGYNLMFNKILDEIEPNIQQSH
jgi:hypothetical protein